MERRHSGKEKLIVPTDFTAPPVQRNTQEDLVPPSHFASHAKSVGAPRGIQISRTPPPIPWINPGVKTVASSHISTANPWLAVTQAQQQILELQKENQRLMMLQVGSTTGHASDRTRATEEREQWSRRESEWHLEAEKHKAEAERLKGQVEGLTEAAGRQREALREKDSMLNRQSHEITLIHEELCKTQTELSQVKEELSQCTVQNGRINSQLERLQRQSFEEVTRLKREVERSRKEAQELALKSGVGRLQAEQEASQQTVTLSEQLKELQMKHEMELQHLTTSYSSKLTAASQAQSELEDKVQSAVSEVLQLKTSLTETCTERDGLTEQLSQMGQAFETQCATLHSLRNYIGQFASEKGEKERLNGMVEHLNKEKEALQRTVELLTVRLNSVNEILALQEEKMVEKLSSDPLVKNRYEGLQMLQLWREKVFKLCVQLRTKDIELRAEKDKLLSGLRSIEQQLQQQHHQANILQHSLDDRIAELDLERVEKETLKRDLVQAHKENSQMMSQIQKNGVESQTLAKAVQRFKVAFESKAADVNAAQARLNTVSQRLAFAKRQVETIQVLLMRRSTLHKVQQASKQSEEAGDSVSVLQTELRLACEERDMLTQELKRTPKLIKKALADLHEQYENKFRQQQKELEQSWMEVQQAAAGRDESRRILQQSQEQLEESKVMLEKLHSELLSQQENSERVLRDRVAELEDSCAEKLREMEVDVSTARREHTKAVMTLRHFERQAARKLDQMRKTQLLQSKHTKINDQKKQLKEAQLNVSEGELSDYTTALLHNSADLKDRGEKPSESSCEGVMLHLPVDSRERLLSVLEELQTLSAAVINSSEDSTEEEEEHQNSMGPSTTCPHS